MPVGNRGEKELLLLMEVDSTLLERNPGQGILRMPIGPVVVA
jgi:hypothetical protein